MKQHIVDELKEGIADFTRWKGDDTCVVFPLVTDLHSHVSDNEKPFSCLHRVSADHLAYLNLAAELANADFSADLGDEGFCVPLKTREDFSLLLSKLEGYYRKSAVPLIHCIGNHDAEGFGYDGAFWGKWLKEQNAGKAAFVTGADGSYGYFDIPGKPCRVFFLNTTESLGECIGKTQLQFLSRHLDELLKSQKTAVVLSHINASAGGFWIEEQNRKDEWRLPELAEVLSAFVAKGGRLAGQFAGDSHFDFFDHVDGVNYFITQGYGGIGIPQDMPQHARTFHYFTEKNERWGTIDYSACCLIDLVAIKLDKREVRIFRLGAGGRYYHRGAKF